MEAAATVAASLRALAAGARGPHVQRMGGRGGAGLGGATPWQLGDKLRAARLGRLPPAVVLGDLTLVRPLGWEHVPVVAVSTDAADVTFRSRYVDGHCVVPGYRPAQENATVAILRALGAELSDRCGSRAPLYYGGDDQLEMLYRHRRELAAEFEFILNEQGLAWAFHDKSQFVELCARAGVRIPPSVVPRTAHEARAAIEALRAPLLVKPRRKSDWKVIQKALFESEAKARVFPSARALLEHPAFANLADRVIVQEYIDAPVTDLLSFHGFAAPDGHLLGWFAGHKLRTYPAIAGESALLELVHDQTLEAVGRDVVARLQVRGPFKIDLIRAPETGELYTLEVNARYNLWHHLGAAHGVNLPALAYDYLVRGREPEATANYQPHLRWMNLYRDLCALREEHSPIGGWLEALLARHTLHEVFAWNDPVPFFAWLRAMLRKRRHRSPTWHAMA